MWYQDNYRRIFLDMHINDDKEIYLSKFDPKAIVELFKGAGAQTIVVLKAAHTQGLHTIQQSMVVHTRLWQKKIMSRK